MWHRWPNVWLTLSWLDSLPGEAFEPHGENYRRPPAPHELHCGAANCPFLVGRIAPPHVTLEVFPIRCVKRPATQDCGARQAGSTGSRTEDRRLDSSASGGSSASSSFASTATVAHSPATDARSRAAANASPTDRPQLSLDELSRGYRRQLRGEHFAHLQQSWLPGQHRPWCHGV